MRKREVLRSQQSFRPCFGKLSVPSECITHIDSGGRAALGLIAEQAPFAQPQVVLKKGQEVARDSGDPR